MAIRTDLAFLIQYKDNFFISSLLLPVLLRSRQNSGKYLNAVPQVLQAQVFVCAVLVIVMVYNRQPDHRGLEHISKQIHGYTAAKQWHLDDCCSSGLQG